MERALLPGVFCQSFRPRNSGARGPFDTCVLAASASPEPVRSRSSFLTDSFFSSLSWNVVPYAGSAVVTFWSSPKAIARAPTPRRTPAAVRVVAAWVRRNATPDVSRCPPMAIASIGIAAPIAYAPVTRMMRSPTSPLAERTVTAASTGPAQGTKTSPRLRPRTRPLPSVDGRRLVRNRSGRSSSHATRRERRLAAITSMAAIARSRRRSSGRPSALRSAPPASVKTVNERMSPAMITYGRRRSVVDALPARISGRTGRTQGESEVMTPATNATPRRINTAEE